MLTYKLIYEDDVIVKYEYHPENRKEFGIISANKKSKEICIEKRAYEDENHDSFFSCMMLNRIRKFLKENKFDKEGMIAWY